MKLRINESALSVESMKQIVDLIDRQVLIDEKRELVEEAQEGAFKEPRKAIRRGRKLWSDEEVRKLMLLRRQGVPYKDAAKKLGKTFDQVKYKIKNMKNAGKWDNNAAEKPQQVHLSREAKEEILARKRKGGQTYRLIANALKRKFGIEIAPEQLKEKYHQIK